jgi:hypothetical protein
MTLVIHVLLIRGVMITPKGTEAAEAWETSKNVMEVGNLLGLAW